MKNYYGIDIKKQREKLLKSRAAKPILDKVIQKADLAITKGYLALKFSDYMIFAQTGDRKTFEKQYFERKNDCSYLAVAYWLTDDEKYRCPLIDLIFHICDEFSWCIPAHSLIYKGITAPEIIGQIDLFQAETASLLTDVLAILGEKLPTLVHERVEYEIRRRIIEPICEREFHWQKESCKTNWAAVCAGGVAVPLLEFGTEEEINKALPVLSTCIEHYLEGFNDDGCCMEGFTYWNYGFAYFAIFARLMLEYTGSKVNYFEREKVKNIACFFNKVRLGKTKIASFSDSGTDFSFSPGLISYLKELYGDDFTRPALEFATRNGNIYVIRDLLWLDADYEEDEFKNQTAYLGDAEWFIKRCENYSFAAKAGHNDEHHNHNDVGSFILVTPDEQMPLADFGVGLYDSKTFDPAYRYKMIQNASFGHSVPIINGKYQNEGREFAASDVKAGENEFSFDISGAYEKGLIKSLRRSFELKEDEIILTDKAEYSAMTEHITERMVSWIKPVISEDSVKLGTVTILFDKNKFTASVTEDSIKSHTDAKPIKIYLIDFEAKVKGEEVFKFEIKV